MVRVRLLVPIAALRERAVFREELNQLFQDVARISIKGEALSRLDIGVDEAFAFYLVLPGPLDGIAGFAFLDPDLDRSSVASQNTATAGTPAWFSCSAAFRAEAAFSTE